MITISTNMGDVISSIQTQLGQIKERRIAEKLAVEVLGLMKKRIHEDGLASDGNPIGTYSKGYMKVRTGNYENNKVTRGKRKGEVKKGTSGVYTAGILSTVNLPSWWLVKSI